jgi:chromosomal replication initiator protein
LSFARFVPVPENRSALAAVQHLAACLCSGRLQRIANPLFLHGPAGSGKTHLISALIEEVTRRSPDLIVSLLQAADLGAFGLQDDADTEIDVLQNARNSDFVIVEDLQHLSARRSSVLESLVRLFDYLHARQRPIVFTATAGPGQLADFPARLTSRLAQGLVVGLEPLGPASRLAVLSDKAQRRQLAVGRDVLAWLSEHLSGGGRELEGAVIKLEALARQTKDPLDVATVASHFREQAEAGQPTVEHIAERVGDYFHVNARHLQSRRRYQSVLLPRQIGMYLTRQLTDLSLKQIGAYFGCRDHSTVLHACRKIERALTRDAALCGAVKQLHAALA